MRRLFQFSNLVWNISLEDQGPKLVLKKASGLKHHSKIAN